MDSNLYEKLTTIHQTLPDVPNEDRQTQINAAWIIVASLLKQPEDAGQLLCRQLLADYMRLPLPRPSKLHSAILGAAIKVARTFPEFRFIPFLALWDLHNLRPEDYNPRYTGEDTRNTIPPLAERIGKAFLMARLLRPDDQLPPEHETAVARLLEAYGFLPVQRMLVTRIQQTKSNEGRRFTFVTLTSPEGIEVECTSHQLGINPLHPLPDGRRHYVNEGQVYDVALRLKKQNAASETGTAPAPVTILAAYLSPLRIHDLVAPAQPQAAPTAGKTFTTAVGYIEHIDAEHKHMHIYDALSRHFVAPLMRFSRETEGQFVRFVPIVPRASNFKTAIILGSATAAESAREGLVRNLRVAAISTDRHYATWALADPSRPITEQLSDFQLAKGVASPTFTQGTIDLARITPPQASIVANAHAAGTPFAAIVFLRRGSDKKKYPYVLPIVLR